MSTVNIKLYDIFRNDLHLPETKARELVEVIQEAVKDDINASKEEYKGLWKDGFRILDSKIDKLEIKLTKAIYLTSLIQFLAIMASVAAIVSFMLHK
jgi:hypothetical protein